MYRLVTLLNLTSMLSISSMIFFSLSDFPELLLIEFRKTGRRYLQVLEIYSCAWDLIYIALAINRGLNADITERDAFSVQSKIVCLC